MALRSTFSKAATVLAIGVAGMSSQQASAAELSTSSSTGSFAFTVVIPPLGASIAAANEGAAGLWTIAGANDGLMIDFGSDELGKPTLNLYRRAGIAAEIFTGAQLEATGRTDSKNNDGLMNDQYRFDGLSAGVETITIRGV
jgi:hypothetical protein